MEFQLRRNLRNPTFRRNTRSDWETKFANDLDQLGARAWHGRNRLLLDSTELMVEHPEVRQGIFGFEELMQAGAMEAGFVEAAAEVGSMSPGSIDHLDLEKEILILADPTRVTNGVRGRTPMMRGPEKLSFPKNVGRARISDALFVSRIWKRWVVLRFYQI